MESIICYLPWQRFLGAREQLGAPGSSDPGPASPSRRDGDTKPISFPFDQLLLVHPQVLHLFPAHSDSLWEDLLRHPGLSPADLRRGPRAGKGEEKQEKKLGWEREWGRAGGGAESPCPMFQLQPCTARRGRLLEGREKGRPMTPHPLRD